METKTRCAFQILIRLQYADRLRGACVLLGILLLLLAYYGIAFRRLACKPATSLLALMFSILFVSTELCYRTVDLFVVSMRWAPQYFVTSSLATRGVISGRIQVWDEVVAGWYFLLLFAHLLASLFFFAATWDRTNRWNQAVAFAFSLNSVRIVGRLLEGYAGQKWLEPFNTHLYYPLHLIIFGMVALWLWHQDASA